MPELPEVETVRRQLSEVLPGQTITQIQILSDKSFQGDPTTITPSTVTGIRRAGKGLIIDLEVSSSRNGEQSEQYSGSPSGPTPIPNSSATSNEIPDHPADGGREVEDDGGEDGRSISVGIIRDSRDGSNTEQTSPTLRAPSSPIKLRTGSTRRGETEPATMNHEPSTMNYSLVIHLKMTGQLIYDSATDITSHSDQVDPKFDHRIVGGHPTKDFIADLPSSHTRVIFTLSDTPVIASVAGQSGSGSLKNSMSRHPELDSGSPAKSANKPEPSPTEILKQVQDDMVSETRNLKPEAGNQHTSKNINECCPQPDWGSKSLNYLYFNDQRKFGWIKLVPTAEVESIPFIAKLGPEPWDISLDDWHKFLSSSRKAVKVRLLDQDKVAGIGNIYANDALWEARIDPSRPANSLNSQEAELLLEKVKLVMDEGIYYGGATAADGKYVDLGGLGGTYQEHFRTYDRAGESCKRPDCDGTIEKITLGGRGTYFCPECQT